MIRRLFAILALSLPAASFAGESAVALNALRKITGETGVLPPPIAGRAAPAGKFKPGEGVDHSDQFPTGSRNQGDVGSCHAFASIGLLEAAYYRKYGEHQAFSDADLFLQNTVLNGNIYSGSILDRGYTYNGKADLKEGGSSITLLATGDIDFAIKHGVATEPQYADFLGRYRRYREAERRTLEGIEREYREMPWYVKLLYNPRTHWKKLQKDPASRKILQNYLLGNDRAIEDQREATRRKLAGFRVVKSLHAAAPQELKLSDARCESVGAGRAESVLAELKAGRPVGVSYVSGAMFASHVLIISGYTVGDDGKAVFKTRNSWGAGGNFDMFPRDMCKVHGIFSVR
ncbi:MAG: hypothetical protein CO113_15680 [Elusimicrobia bacterium CG_4_9_14_3_um_filter_62_55]|nr:MAG: hypothetical protein COR54_13810 [Elusimicrobia bacterium CG22_combo_CG10-13_8_21_14_all_63_91]PJA16735.1 MAG: hypothetical protein COX66_06710 [Elusimicrobia bacterium CG_4_10_14_0_2_um_filter_63_34]PJB24081.1 MAG: hypothetical protein CO113_15680 [Elusimicrobia bacterium CG_4_9_14_3_um_filter_62_55]